MKSDDKIIEDYRKAPSGKQDLRKEKFSDSLHTPVRHTPIAEIKNNIEDYLGLFKSPERVYFEDDLTEVFNALENGTLDYSVYSIVVEPNPFVEKWFVAQYAMVSLDGKHDFTSQSEKPFWGFEFVTYDLSLYSTLKLLSSLHHGSRFKLSEKDTLSVAVDIDIPIIQAFSYSSYKDFGSFLSKKSKLMSSEIEASEQKVRKSKLDILFD